MKTTLYRMLDTDGNEQWRGRACDASHAEEKCFWDESPGSFERFTLQRWGVVRISSTMKTPGWVTVYTNQPLAAI